VNVKTGHPVFVETSYCLLFIWHKTKLYFLIIYLIKKIQKVERKSLKNRNKNLNCKSKIISQW